MPIAARLSLIAWPLRPQICGNAYNPVENSTIFYNVMSLAADLKPPAEQARAWLAHQLPAVSGQDGHRSTLRVASLLRIGFRLGEGEVSSLMADYNRTCAPPWSENELAHKVASAFASVPRHAIGFMLAPERPTITRAKPVAASVRRISLGPPPAPPPQAPAPVGLCPTCWSRRVIAPINGPTCSCKPYNWPTWTPAQVEADAGR